MKTKKKIIVIFIIVHIFLITALFIYLCYLSYPREVGMARWRSGLLQEIYDELKVYKADTGAYPKSIDSLLQFDKEKMEVFFCSKKLKGGYRLSYYSYDNDEFDINEYIHYRLINGEPVLTDLGTDKELGGMGKDFDVTYPAKYQEPLSIRNFIKTEQFSKSLVLGVIFASIMSLCLYKMWEKRLTRGKRAVLVTIVLSILFVVFELFLATAVLGAHIYPHH